MSRGIVLSLCDRTTAMVQPWLEAGFEAHCVDLQHPAGVTWDHKLATVGADITVWEPKCDYDIVFAFPPCTHLAQSGARWFKDKGMRALIEGLTLVERCRVLCEQIGAPYMIENPVGQLSTYWRKPDMLFDPYEYAGWCDNPTDDAYTKRTCLWVGGGFQPPLRRPHEPVQGSKMHLLSPSPERANLRSVTPIGFARAVFAANVDRIGRAA